MSPLLVDSHLKSQKTCGILCTLISGVVLLAFPPDISPVFLSHYPISLTEYLYLSALPQNFLFPWLEMMCHLMLSRKMRNPKISVCVTYFPEPQHIRMILNWDGRFRLDIRRKFFTQRVVWNTLEQSAQRGCDVPSLKAFKARLDRILSSLI